MKRQLLLVMLCSTTLSPAAALATTTYFNNGAGYSDTGSWTSDGITSYIRANARYSQTITDTATWSLAPTAGSYVVQVYWLAYDGGGITPSTTDGRYALTHASGTDNFDVNMLQLSRQDATYALPGNNGGATRGSGWYTLGTYNLNGSSSVTLSNLAASGTLFADAVRISDESVLVDPLSAAGSYNASWLGSGSVSPIATSASFDTAGTFTYANAADAELIVTPGLSGLRDVKVSWSPSNANNRATVANYLVDLDGNLGTTGDQTLTILNMNLLADQVTLGGAGDDWSGFYDLGQFNLTPSSIIQLTNNDGISSTGYLTPGVLEISYPVPEPSTGLLAMLGFAALARYWRRRR